MKFWIRFSILLVVLGIISFWMKMVMTAQRQQVTNGQTAGLKEEPRRTSVTLDSFLHAQQLRKRQLSHFCSRFPHLRALNASGSAERLLSSMTVSHKLMTLYCKPADVIIEGWEELVQAVERRFDVTLRNPLPVDDNDTIPDQLAKYNPTMLAKMLRTYTKVLFVVDPYERLVTNYMQGNSGEVSFEEFIEDILLTEPSEGGVSSSSVISLCYPCFVRYDYIVLFDFLQVELPHILRRIGLPESVELLPPIDPKVKMTSKWLLENLLPGLDKDQLEQLSKLYSWDFAAFPLAGNRIMFKILSQL